MIPSLCGWEAFPTTGALTHTMISWAFSPSAPQVPGVTPGSPLCPWCFGHPFWRGARHKPFLHVVSFEQLWHFRSLGRIFVCPQTHISTQLRDTRKQCLAIQQNPWWITKNKWKCVELLDGYYVVGVIVIPYLGLGAIINIVSKEDISYHIVIDDIPHYTCINFTKLSSHALGKKGKWVHCKHLNYMFRFLC